MLQGRPHQTPHLMLAVLRRSHHSMHTRLGPTPPPTARDCTGGAPLLQQLQLQQQPPLAQGHAAAAAAAAAAQPLFDSAEGLETPIQLIYLTALLGFLAAGAYLVVRQVLIRRELDEAAKALGERIRTGEATCEVWRGVCGAVCVAWCVCCVLQPARVMSLGQQAAARDAAAAAVTGSMRCGGPRSRLYRSQQCPWHAPGRAGIARVV
jgi:hypothetical protein